jgi:hypothetical protein
MVVADCRGPREGNGGLIAVVSLALTGCVTEPLPQPVAATPPPAPRSKPPPPPPKVVWDRIDGQRDPEVTQLTEVDFATVMRWPGPLRHNANKGTPSI